MKDPRASVRVGFRLALLCLVAGTFAHQVPAGVLGQFDGHADVGKPRLSGSAAYNGVSQEYSVAAAGFNMWGSRDEFHFVWKRLRGDFILQARVEFVGSGVDPHRKLGWMVRETLEDDSAYADAAVHGDGLTSLQYRTAKALPPRRFEPPSPGRISFNWRGRAASSFSRRPDSVNRW